MRTNTTSGLIALFIAAPIAAVAALLSNTPAHGGQFLLSPAVLMAEAELIEQEGMMGQGGMGGMMNQGHMGQGETGGMGGMMNMMQQMSHGGLAKHLIREEGFTGEQIARVWDLSDGCGGDGDHAH